MEGKSLMPKWGTRHTFITLSFFLMIMNQCWRINLSVAIVAMVNHGKYFKSKVKQVLQITYSILFPFFKLGMIQEQLQEMSVHSLKKPISRYSKLKILYKKQTFACRLCNNNTYFSPYFRIQYKVVNLIGMLNNKEWYVINSMSTYLFLMIFSISGFGSLLLWLYNNHASRWIFGRNVQFQKCHTSFSNWSNCLFVFESNNGKNRWICRIHNPKSHPRNVTGKI